jgi:hypothetical protein
MKLIILIPIIFILILFAIIVEFRIKSGKTKLVDTYSYKPVIKRSFLHLIIVIIISLLVYMFSKSLEVAVTLGIFLLICVVGGGLFGLLLENQTKRRGGRKVD